MKVLGMTKEKYMGSVLVGHNNDFKEVQKELVRHHLFLEDNSKLFKMTLSIEHGQCGSGYATAEEVIVELNEISEVPSNILKSKINREFQMVNSKMNEYSCDLFSFSRDGGDRYYPCGNYSVNEELFGKNK